MYGGRRWSWLRGGAHWLVSWRHRIGIDWLHLLILLVASVRWHRNRIRRPLLLRPKMVTGILVRKTWVRRRVMLERGRCVWHMSWPSIRERNRGLHRSMCLVMSIHGRGQKGDARSGSMRESLSRWRRLRLALLSASCRHAVRQAYGHGFERDS